MSRICQCAQTRYLDLIDELDMPPHLSDAFEQLMESRHASSARKVLLRAAKLRDADITARAANYDPPADGDA